MISVIIPCFNCSDTIIRAYESVKNSYNVDIEIILIDDGSTDNTLSVIKNIKKKDSRVKIIESENRGVSYARNLGLRVASGEYVSFIDSDDYISPYMLCGLKELYADDIGLAICDFSSDKLDELPFKFKTIYLNQNKVFIEMIKSGSVQGFVCNKLYSMIIIKKYNLFFNCALEIEEDFDFNMRYIKYIKLAALIPKKLYFYDIEASKTMFCGMSQKKITHVFNQIQYFKYILPIKNANNIIMAHNVVYWLILLNNIFKLSNEYDNCELEIMKLLDKYIGVYFRYFYFFNIKYLPFAMLILAKCGSLIKTAYKVRNKIQSVLEK